VLSDRTLGDEAMDFKLEVLLSKARAIAEGDPARKAAFHDVALALEQMASKPERRDKLSDYAKMALELEEPAVAARFYTKAADGDGPHKTDHLELAGKWFRAANDNAAAAETYERAANATQDPERSEQLALTALDCLEGANRVEDAYRAARRYTTRYADRRMEQRTIALASASGHVIDARDLGRTMLESTPNDLAVIEAQARRELWAGDPSLALPLIQRARALAPDDVGLRELEAHVAEWSGRPELALDDWLWLLTHGHADLVNKR
jgi:polysaccharide biosynthesis protein PelB